MVCGMGAVLARYPGENIASSPFPSPPDLVGMKRWGCAQNVSYFLFFSLSFSGEQGKMEISVPHGMRIELGCHFFLSLGPQKARWDPINLN